MPTHQPPPVAGLDPARVAEILVTAPAGQPGRRGSGYRVGARCVLTAAHVVGGPGTVVHVRFDADRPGEWTARARVLLASAAADAALLEITDAVPDADATPPRPVRFGAVPEADVVLACSTMGFPRFKLRADPMRRLGSGETVPPARYRDSCHATGTISALSNRREGTLELAVTAPHADPDPARSPWEGMSGAAVWHAGTLIGLISAHHPADGLGRLAATRVDRWYDLLTPAELALLHEHAGLPPAATGPDPAAALPEPEPDPAATEPNPGADAPAPPSPFPRTLPLLAIEGLVSALTDLPTVRNATSLALLLDSVKPEVAAHSPRHPALRVDVINIVRTCLSYGALDQLLEAVRLMEGDSAGVARMEQEAALLRAAR